MSLTLTPITIRAAKAHIKEHHRHHKPPLTALFCIGVEKDGELVGVAMVERPKARMIGKDKKAAEVSRLATDGSRNACSMLYGACWRAWRAMGGTRLVTYILESEPGISLRAAGWELVEENAGGGSWSREDRPRTDKHPLEPKQRWERRA